MTRNKLKAVFFLGTMLAASLLVFGFSVSAEELPYVEYRNGVTVRMNNQDYLFATNNGVVEILAFNKMNILYKVSEIRLPQKAKDVVITKEGNKLFATVTTGQFLYRIDVTDPQKLDIVLKRDMYQNSRGRFRVGTVYQLATNGKKIFIASQFGVRSMGLDNLQVERIYHYEKSYGVAVKGNTILAQDENKAYAYDLNTGRKLAEVKTANADKQMRRPAIANDGSAMVISDNSLMRMVGNSSAKYWNPVKSGHASYAAAVIGNNVYYVNGYGVTKLLSGNLKKQGFYYSIPDHSPRSWAVGIISANINGKDSLIVFNKSGVFVLNADMREVSQYRPDIEYQYEPKVEVKLDALYIKANQNLNARFSGFYPNEMIQFKVADKTYAVRSNNLGLASLAFNAPAKTGKALIVAKGEDSGLEFETSQTIR